jgi:hypothetical protein
VALAARLLPLAAGLVLAGCASTGPRVLALPGSGKTLDQFHADDGACREWAGRASSDRRGYDMAYLQCMYAKGNRIPVTGGRQPAYVSPPAGSAAPGAPPAPPEPSR